MKVRSKAPLRLGIAGGGTDVSPYSEVYGGYVLNATINMYANTFIDDDVNQGHVKFYAKDIGISDSIDITEDFSVEGPLVLHRAVYKTIMEEYNNGEYLPLNVITFCDAPPGSGLGSSSSMVVSMLECYRQLMNLPFGEYDLASLAYHVERVVCGLSGGKQDQYAATFGGFNFMEFSKDDHVIVNPLRIRRYIINELEASLVLVYLGASRDSAKIINDQISSIRDAGKSLKAMHKVKSTALLIKALLLQGDIASLAKEFKLSWEAKKATSKSISNQMISNLENHVLDGHAISMKVSGAGGGGFVMIFVEPEFRIELLKQIEDFGLTIQPFNFVSDGVISWTI